jgi:hypothetical protein
VLFRASLIFFAVMSIAIGIVLEPSGVELALEVEYPHPRPFAK